jgi:acetoin utilization protein AcuB
MKNKLIKDAMTAFPYTIGDDQPLEAAKIEMARHNIRHLPVLHGGVCVGLLSDRDIKLAYAVEPDKASRIKIKDACAGDVYTVATGEPLGAVAAHMAQLGIGSAVVVDEREKVVGIFTTTDACRALSEVLV